MGTTTRNLSGRFQGLVDRALYQHSMYVFIGNGVSYADEATAPTANNSNYNDIALDPSRDMIYGKKVAPADASPVIDRHNWLSGNVYEAYSNDSNTLFTRTDADDVKPFYVYTSSGNVYKCIDNNGSASSTVEPSHQDLTPREESDGYKWKYMYTVDPLSQFITTEHIPVSANLTITAASDATIERMEVSSVGNTYVETANGTVAAVTNTTVFSIESPSLSYANGLAFTPADDFFNGTSILIYSEGARETGTLHTITDYDASASRVTVDTEATVTTSKRYEITPRVKIEGDGTGATAIATVNQTTKSITGIEMKNVGTGYSYAEASIVANTGQGATATAIISPPGGHGSNPHEELGSEQISIRVDIDEDESGDILGEASNSIRQFGVIVNPSPANSTPTGTVTLEEGKTLVTGTSSNFEVLYTTPDLSTIAGQTVAAVDTSDLSNTLIANTAKADILVDLMNEFNERIITAGNLEKIIIEDGDFYEVRSVTSVESNTALHTLEAAPRSVADAPYRELYTGSTFDQTTLHVMDPATAFTAGERIASADGSEYATVVHTSANNVYTVGMDITANTTVTGSSSSLSATVVTTTPNANSIDPTTGDVVYINNVVPVSKTASSNVAINITFKV